ncbi:hypothetical protein HZZ00_37285 (plasmid) [Streptomyces sp. NEAU-sy36]|uniref:hypothetical protein n=1 Tax=unclassified Streptomyces TaxID=2593676 RepID=UPI0015D5D2DE|nr:MULTISPECIES: hypothetical protein [unclassified Streptomyces]QLJ06688.1 hypothetical protein HZZ00_37285 [Streptomyces sp. NEAU-sy36]
MSAARQSPPPPDLGSLGGDFERLRKLREEREQEQRQDPESKTAPGGGTEDQEERPARRSPRPGRSRGGRRPPPAAADAVPTTVRFDPEEAAEVDFFVLELRDDAGRRTLDKAEVIREALRLAREHEPTRKALLRRLR